MAVGQSPTAGAAHGPGEPGPWSCDQCLKSRSEKKRSKAKTSAGEKNS